MGLSRSDPPYSWGTGTVEIPDPDILSLSTNQVGLPGDGRQKQALAPSPGRKRWRRNQRRGRRRKLRRTRRRQRKGRQEKSLHRFGSGERGRHRDHQRHHETQRRTRRQYTRTPPTLWGARGLSSTKLPHVALMYMLTSALVQTGSTQNSAPSHRSDTEIIV
ncbi:hypothetical protein NDU88_005512 [Pleurodeles waltl]|uniref:Uncharacterized protein n=1 Tax=Pleurodeles waltl TaxID=8319 RepID=A0AAV7TV11_PLEWA|nr:hypothetical protein NDU88_005512 [Pleurodeles waltl]